MEDALTALFSNATGYVGVAIPIIKLLVDYLKNTFNLKGVMLNVMPMIVGLVFMIGIGIYLNGDIVTFILGGIIAGLGASGFHDATQTTVSNQKRGYL